MLEVEDTCVYEIPGYGVCGKEKGHVVHMLAGMSPREHFYKRPNQKAMEISDLTPDTLDRVAHRSGRRKEDLVVMLASAEVKHENLQVQYEVVNDSEPDISKEENDGSEAEEGTADGILPEV